MKLKDFIQGIECRWKKFFPRSKCEIYFTENIYGMIFAKFYLANESFEVQYGIWRNDMFSIAFSIDTIAGSLPKTLTELSELPENLRLTSDARSYFIKPEQKMFAYGSRKLNFRKTIGNAEKLLFAFEKFFKQLRETLLSDWKNDNICKQHIELVRSKLIKEG